MIEIDAWSDLPPSEVGISITSWKRPDELLSCIKSIELNEPVGYPVLVIYAFGETIDPSIRYLKTCEEHRQYFFKKIPTDYNIPRGRQVAVSFWQSQVGVKYCFLTEDDATIKDQCVSNLLSDMKSLELDGEEVGILGAIGGFKRFYSHETQPFDIANSGTGMLINLEAFRTVGGFDPSVPVGEDRDLSIRMRLFGYRVMVSPNGDLHHVRNKEGSTGEKDKWLAQMLPANSRMKSKYGDLISTTKDGKTINKYARQGVLADILSKWRSTYSEKESREEFERRMRFEKEKWVSLGKPVDRDGCYTIASGECISDGPCIHTQLVGS